MKRSWRRTAVEDVGGGVLRTEIFNLDKRVVLVEYDVRPHLIGPKEAEALTVGPGGGVLRASAEHPGSQGQLMLHKSLAWIEARWPEIAEREIELLLREEGHTRF